MGNEQLSAILQCSVFISVSLSAETVSLVKGPRDRQVRSLKRAQNDWRFRLLQFHDNYAN